MHARLRAPLWAITDACSASIFSCGTVTMRGKAPLPPRGQGARSSTHNTHASTYAGSPQQDLVWQQRTGVLMRPRLTQVARPHRQPRSRWLNIRRKQLCEARGPPARRGRPAVRRLLTCPGRLIWRGRRGVARRRSRRACGRRNRRSLASRPCAASSGASVSRGSIAPLVCAVGTAI